MNGEYTMTTTNQPQANPFLAAKPAGAVAKKVSPASAPAQSGHNSEVASLKSKLQSIVSSLQVMKEERENISEVLGIIKDEHQIEPKVARKVAKFLHEPDSVKDFSETYELVNELYNKIKG